MRQWFNSNVLNRLNQLSVQIVKDQHPTISQAGQPYCTRTQILLYKEGGCTLALACRFMKLDGTLGASGKPDPKAIYISGQIYIQD